jgi:hypothetical protein
MDPHKLRLRQNRIMIKYFTEKLKFVDTNCILCKKIIETISIERTRESQEMDLDQLEKKTKALYTRPVMKRETLISGLKLCYRMPIKIYNDKELIKVRRVIKEVIKITRQAEEMLGREVIPD